MEKNFIRAKSDENKAIRIQEIMDVTDRLFHEHSYHEITLSTIAKEFGFARGGLYKYVTSKEEIFLLIYTQKQEALLKDLLKELEMVTITKETFSKVMSDVCSCHLDFIKYHQILNAIIETNVSLERLAEFKIQTNIQTAPLYKLLESAFQMTYFEAFDFYLTIIYHCVYLYDRTYYQSNYVKAMKLANLPIEDIDFKTHLYTFIYHLLNKK